MSENKIYFTLDEDFQMHRGGFLLNPTIAYETWGELNNQKDNAVFIFTGLSPSSHAASSKKDPREGWWEGIIGPKKSIDTEKFFVICMNSLGSCFGSTGPSSVNPKTNDKYRMTFPILSLEDIARAGMKLINHLQIESLHTNVGPSIGGMSSIAFELLFPGFTKNLILISTGPHSISFTIALRSLQREMIYSDPEWNNGNYHDSQLPLKGMKLARKLGMMTYRSSDEWLERFSREKISKTSINSILSPSFQIESYLDHNADKFTSSFDPNAYLYLSKASDLFDACDYGNSLDDSINKISASRVGIIGVKSDFLFPVYQQRQLVDIFKRSGKLVEYLELNSIQGHDSFLVDIDKFSSAIKSFFKIF
ncbi:MAG: homoserine O-acetyltransferase [Gammaproteobacteria bacterium TMED78]|mgnify:CR=1 FL=1|nr:MAG: homoserine O-acetyltransferase [Gammaproteobacteria bacterium TMED78]|tara:strand:- start:43321 stop:44415 length:1095 start_codon:yes stop_codon:yes gene_type:complete